MIIIHKKSEILCVRSYSVIDIASTIEDMLDLNRQFINKTCKITNHLKKDTTLTNKLPQYLDFHQKSGHYERTEM